MAESNRCPPRCPCGFYGTSENMGLCSKCYKEKHQKKSEEAAETSPVPTAASGLDAQQFSSLLAQATPQQPETNVFADTKPESSTTDEAVPGTSTPPQVASTSTSDGSAASSTGSGAAESNNNKREAEDTPDPDRPVQKNKKRCFKCNCKLELAIREIGRCKCDYVFCQLHRLPEQHDCIYDHKEKGRKEARDKMVSPKKHIGTSLRRIDSDNS